MIGWTCHSLGFTFQIFLFEGGVELTISLSLSLSLSKRMNLKRQNALQEFRGSLTFSIWGRYANH